jgi:thymidylate synthase (FAD)
VLTKWLSKERMKVLKIDVLDQGYVRLRDWMGTDLDPVNDAKVSYDKMSTEFKAKEERLLNFLGREGHCYDDQTEVLTSVGFKKWADVTQSDLLGVVDPKTGEFIGFEKPSDLIVQDVDGALIHFHTSDIDLLVTEGHQLYCSFSSTKEKRVNPSFELVKANKVIGSKLAYEKPIRMKKSSSRNAQLGIDIGKEWFKLYGFFIGDGAVASRNTIKFHLKKGRKIDFLKNVCRELEIELKEQASDNYSITGEGLGEKFRALFYDKSKKKTFPDSFFYMNQDQFWFFMDGLKNSDGSTKRNTWVYDTGSKGLANKIQCLGAINGETISISKTNSIYRLNFSSRRNQPRLNEHEGNRAKKVQYKGKVYCATVSTGLLIVRRNQKVVLSGNSSPFRHSILKFECYAPLMIARQWWKYIIGSDHDEQTERNNDPFLAWNESSRRYITEEPKFYVVEPDQWRSKPDNSKQGSGDYLPEEVGEELTTVLLGSYNRCLDDYEWAMEMGVAPEQARLFLPAYGMYVRWVWTASLQGVCHLLNQRLAHDAQKEFQEYAQAVHDLSAQVFPHSIQALVKSGGKQ